jgi:hypothetical protein
MYVTQNHSQPLRGVSQMHRPAVFILSIVLAQGALAQCAAPAATTTMTPATHAQQQQQHQQPQQRAGAELIKTAAASTRDDAPPAVRATATNHAGQDQPRRGGTAMLLAALALMSGIALRRYGGRGT